MMLLLLWILKLPLYLGIPGPIILGAPSYTMILYYTILLVIVNNATTTTTILLLF